MSALLGLCLCLGILAAILAAAWMFDREHWGDYATAIAAAFLGGLLGPCIARTAFPDHPLEVCARGAGEEGQKHLAENAEENGAEGRKEAARSALGRDTNAARSALGREYRGKTPTEGTHLCLEHLRRVGGENAAAQDNDRGTAPNPEGWEGGAE